MDALTRTRLPRWSVIACLLAVPGAWPLLGSAAPPPLVAESAGDQLRRGLAVARTDHVRAEAEGQAPSTSTRAPDPEPARLDAEEAARLADEARKDVAAELAPGLELTLFDPKRL